MPSSLSAASENTPVAAAEPQVSCGQIEGILASYEAEERTRHLDSIFLPSRIKTATLIKLLRRLVFPGFFEQERIVRDRLREHVTALLGDIHALLYEQIRQALRHQANRVHGDGRGDTCDTCDQVAAEKAAIFLDRIPEVRRLLALDVQATFDGDPAAADTDETIFCYPGIDAIFIHRAAHELWRLEIPLLPRLFSEYAHRKTGIDIHPGARIGERFCIDHGTGIVIGETTDIGRNVKIYQGVTLGALSLKGGHEQWQGRKRHPTIQDDVTIYGGAIILGGDTVIGAGATIGGSVFITHSIPAGHTVTMKKAELEIRPPKTRPANRG